MPDNGVEVKSGWTVDTLKQYVDTLRETDQRAITKSDEATEKRFEGVNEFRQALNDQARVAAERASEFVGRREYEGGINATKEMIAALSGQLSRADDRRAGARTSWGTIAAIIASVGVVIASIVGIVTVFTGTHALPVAAPVTYVQTPAGQALVAPAPQR